MTNYAIRNYEDLIELANDLSDAIKVLPKNFSPMLKISIDVSEEVFDKVGLQLRNRNLTYIDLSNYSEMSLVLSNIRIELKIR